MLEGCGITNEMKYVHVFKCHHKNTQQNHSMKGTKKIFLRYSRVYILEDGSNMAELETKN
jgi:hypothetical protein